MPTTATRNAYEIKLTNFTVLDRTNNFSRTNRAVAGSRAESGSLKYGKVIGTNATNDAATGKYFISNFTSDTAYKLS